jgi:hypothetical protein
LHSEFFPTLDIHTHLSDLGVNVILPH